MGKCPQPVTDSSDTKPIDSNETIDLVDNAKKIGFSFRTIPVEDKRVTSSADYRLMSVEDKPKTTTVPKPVDNKSKNTSIGFTPVVVTTTTSTKKPVKL